MFVMLCNLKSTKIPYRNYHKSTKKETKRKSERLQSSLRYKKRQNKIYAHFMIHMHHAYDTGQIQYRETQKSMIAESSIINSSLITVQL